MSVLLQIADTHFGTEQPQVAEALVTLAVQQRPDVVVLSGDITQRARPAQFRAAKALVDQLAAPVLAIPGNHDMALFDLWADAGDCCLIERWDFAGRDLGFVRAAVTPVQPQRVRSHGSAVHGVVSSLACPRHRASGVHWPPDTSYFAKSDSR